MGLALKRHIFTLPLALAVCEIATYKFYDWRFVKMTGISAVIGAYFLIRCGIVAYQYANYKGLIDCHQELRRALPPRRNFHRVYQEPVSGTVFYVSYDSKKTYIWGIEWDALMDWQKAYKGWAASADRDVEPPACDCIAYEVGRKNSNIRRYTGGIRVGMVHENQKPAGFYMRPSWLQRHDTVPCDDFSDPQVFLDTQRRLRTLITQLGSGQLRHIGGKGQFRPQPPLKRQAPRLR